MSIRQDLEARLGEFDGKAISLLSEAEAALSHEPDYLDTLIALVPSQLGGIGDGATWLLKSHLEKDGKLASVQIDQLCEGLTEVVSWAAVLHICQMAQHLAFTERQAGRIADWLYPLLSHARPFVRAWALDALFRIAQQHQRHDVSFDQAMVAARKDPAASVRARARNLG